MDKGPIAALLSSRKGVLTLLVVVMATLLEVAIIVATFRGELKITEAIALSFGTLFASTLAALATIKAIGQEDAAAKGSPKIEAISGVTELAAEAPKPVINITVNGDVDPDRIGAAVKQAVEKIGAGIAILALSLGLCATQAGCSWLTPARGVAASELAACVLERWGEPPEQIAIDCRADIVDVLRVEKAAKASMAKTAAPKCGAP